MREIKFRVWIIAKKQMLYDSGYPQTGFDGETAPKHGNHIWMEYTGLKDAKGREIYEGDILSLNVPAQSGKIVANTVVRWHETLGYWDCRWQQNRETGRSYSLSKATRRMREHEATIEVIGNVYENSDLLK